MQSKIQIIPRMGCNESRNYLLSLDCSRSFFCFVIGLAVQVSALRVADPRTILARSALACQYLSRIAKSRCY